MSKILELSVKNYRCLGDVTLPLNPINVFFGPNGSGKTTFFDAFWFVKDCMMNGVEKASADRSHGIGTLWAKAPHGENIHIAITIEHFRYELAFEYTSGRVGLFPGERLQDLQKDVILFERKPGNESVESRHAGSARRELLNNANASDGLLLPRYSDLTGIGNEEAGVYRAIRQIHNYSARAVQLYRLRKFGSEASYQTALWDYGQNLWSALRNLHDRQAMDKRYNVIMDFMKKAFPGFNGLFIEQTGNNSVYASFLERNREQPVHASGVSDGHIQLLIHLTALFGELSNEAIILFDEPETSLHPYAISVFAEAVKFAVSNYGRQVFIATHSPVLLSQFDPDDIVATGMSGDKGTTMRRIREIPEIKDLLEDYSAGSLYMAELIGRQSVEEEP